jgi:hypothetical protein
MQPKFTLVSNVKKSRKRPVIIPVSVGILEMIALAWARKAAMVVGAFFGFAVSAGTYWVWHCELHTTSHYTLATFADARVVLVLGGLVYSMGTVIELAQRAFRQPWKALAFTVYMEALMVLSVTWWVTLVALVYLAALNALGTGVIVARSASNGEKL